MPFSYFYSLTRPYPRSRAMRVVLPHKLTSLVAVCVIFSVFELSGFAQTKVSKGTDDPALDGKVESLLKQMTLEEKIGQLVQYSAGQPTGPGTGRTDYEEMIAHSQVGSFLNVNEPKLINSYQRIAMEKTRLHIPILFGLDVIHGFRTEFPIPLGMASSWDPSVIEKASHAAASRSSG